MFIQHTIVQKGTKQNYFINEKLKFMTPKPGPDVVIAHNVPDCRRP